MRQNYFYMPPFTISWRGGNNLPFTAAHSLLLARLYGQDFCPCTSFKGDELLKALRSLGHTNSSENWIMRVIVRLLCAKVRNAAVVHRFASTKLKGLLSDIHDYVQNHEKGNNALRHDVERCATFSGFARFLAREFKKIPSWQLN